MLKVTIGLLCGVLGGEKFLEMRAGPVSRGHASYACHELGPEKILFLDTLKLGHSRIDAARPSGFLGLSVRAGVRTTLYVVKGSRVDFLDSDLDLEL